MEMPLYTVFDDTDVDAAVAGKMVAKLRSKGDTCFSASRSVVNFN